MNIPLESFSRAEEADVWLRDALRGRRLVYEVGLDERAREPLLGLLRAALAAECRGDFYRLERRYPALLLAAVVTDAVFAYTAGELWDLLEIPGRPTEIGNAFVRALEALSLELFPVFDEQGAQRYVSRILAHGGVPVYCLADLFRLTGQARSRGMTDAQDVIELLTEQASWQHIDRPVLRFLRDTGRVGRDFLQRVLELPEESDSAEADERVADRLGLPLHIVQAFRKFEPERPASGRALAVPRPRVLFDPDISDAPELLLPSDEQRPIDWRVQYEQGPDVPAIDVPAGTNGEVRLPLAPAARWRVIASSSGGEALRVFSITGVSEGRPVLVFDVETGEMPADPRFAAGREAWVVAPCKLLPGSADIEVLHTLPMNGEGWTGWFVHDVVINAPGELSGTHRMQPVKVRLGVEEAVRVRFGNVVPGASTTDGRPVFSGPPILDQVPWTAEDADRWQITLSGPSLGTHIFSPGTLSDVNAALARALGEHGVTDFQLKMRGPVGGSFRTSAVVVRGLRAEVPESPLFPGEDVRIPITAAPEVVLSYGGNSATQLSLSGTNPRAIFEAADPSGQRSEIVIRCDAVRWRLRTGAGTPAPFGNTVVRRTIPRQHSGRTMLQLDTGRTASPARLVAGDLSALPISHPRHREKSNLLQFELAPFLSFLFNAAVPVLRVDAEIGERRFPVLELDEQLVLRLQRVAYDAGGSTSDGTTRLSYELEQSKDLAGRCITVTSADRPWMPPLRLRLGNAGPVGNVDCPPLRKGRYAATVGLELEPGVLQTPGVQPPLTFDVSSDVATPAICTTPDEREVLVEVVRGGRPPSSAIQDPERVAPAAVLLLGSHECRSDAAARVTELLKLPLQSWIQAFDVASVEYGLSRSAAVRAGVRILARIDRWPDVPTESGTFASRLLRIAAVRGGTTAPDARPLLEELAGADGEIPLRSDGVLGSNAVAEDLERLRAELQELERLPSTPLSANGRVLGLMRVRVGSKEHPGWIETLARGYPGGNADLQLLPAEVARSCKLARGELRNSNFPDGWWTLLLHVESFEAAAHVVYGTPKAIAAGEFLASVAKVFPEYVETRVGYFLVFGRRVGDDPQSRQSAAATTHR